MNSKQHQSELFVLFTLNLAILLWGFSGLFGKWVEVDAYNLTFWRMAIAFVPMAMLYRMRHKAFLQFDLSLCLKNIICAILLAVHWISFFTVIQMSTVALGIVFHASFVFMVAALEPVLFKDKPKPIVVIAAIVGCAGLIFTLYSQAFPASAMLWFYGLLTAGCYAALSLINRGVLRAHDTMDCMTAQFFYGAVLLLPLSLFGVTEFFTLSSAAFGKVLLLGLFATAIGHTIYFWSLRYVTATKAGVLTLLEPVYGIIFAAIFFAEYPDAQMMIGSAIVVLSASVIALLSNIAMGEDGREPVTAARSNEKHDNSADD